MSGFLGQLLESLPLAQRLLRYRQLSQEALQQATKIENDELRAGYLSMAAGWHILATEIEKLRDRQRAAEEFPEIAARVEDGDGPSLGLRDQTAQ
jgi:tellurite resistance protein